MKTFLVTLCLAALSFTIGNLHARSIALELSDNQPLFQAIVNNQSAAVKKCIQEDPQIVLLEDEKICTTPLMAAASKGHIDILKLLLAAGAPIDAIDKKGNTALMYALCNSKESTKVIKFFINYKADLTIPNEDDYTPIMLAASNNRCDSLRMLLKAGVDIEEKGALGYTPLFAAVANNAEEGLKSLVELGANLETRDKWSMTPLIHAAFEDNSKFVKILLQLGADINAVTTKPITVETKRFSYEIFPDKSTIAKGSTALQIAIQYKKESAQKALENWPKK